MFDWTIIGPLAIILLAVTLGFFRRYMVRKKKERLKDWAEGTAAGEARSKEIVCDLSGRGYESDTDVVAPKPPPEPTIEDKYRDMRELARQRKDVTSKAHQEAQYRAVELNEPVLLVFHDPRDTKDGAMLYSITPCPHDDPRRKTLDNGDFVAMVTVVDNRPLGHEMIDETTQVMPRSYREKHEADTLLREQAIREASSPAVQVEIDAHKLYKRGIDQKARQEFEAALPEILAEAELKAALMAEAPERHTLLLVEAQERGIGYPAVLAEFVTMVADLAVKEARERFAAGKCTSDDPLTQSFAKAVVAGGWKY